MSTPEICCRFNVSSLNVQISYCKIVMWYSISLLSTQWYLSHVLSGPRCIVSTEVMSSSPLIDQVWFPCFQTHPSGLQWSFPSMWKRTLLSDCRNDHRNCWGSCGNHKNICAILRPVVLLDQCPVSDRHLVNIIGKTQSCSNISPGYLFHL